MDRVQFIEKYNCKKYMKDFPFELMEVYNVARQGVDLYFEDGDCPKFILTNCHIPRLNTYLLSIFQNKKVLIQATTTHIEIILDTKKLRK